MSPESQNSKKHIVSDTWFLEIGASLLSISSFIVILVLLLHYDGKPQFQWHGVTLNAVISVLATVSRIGIVAPVAESLAQWKWMNFSKGPRRLVDFELLDDASRGTRGSLLLLWEKKSWTLTSIGAWIIILSAAIEPFFQQIISFDDAVNYYSDGNVQIAFANRWDGGTEQGTQPANDYSSSNGTDNVLHVFDYGIVQDIHLDFTAQAAVLFGLSADTTQVAQQLRTQCKTGNCTWPPYLSLAVCSSCSDVSSAIKTTKEIDFPMEWFYPGQGSREEYDKTANLTAYYLPNGLNLNNRDPNQDYLDQSDPVLMTARSTLRPSQTLTFQDHTTMIWSTSVLRVLNSSYPASGMWTDPAAVNVHGTECGLYMCIKEYSSAVANGEFSEEFKEVASSRSKVSWQVNIAFEGQTPDIYEYGPGISPAVDALYSNTTYFPRSDLTIEVPHDMESLNGLKSANMTQAGIDSLSAYISDLFNDGTFNNATLPIKNGTKCFIDGSNKPCGEISNVTGMIIQTFASDSQPINQYSPPVMQVLWNSTNLNTTFANLAESITIAMRKLSTGPPTVHGELGNLETLLKVRWPWITLPFLCLCISLAFLTVSIFEAYKDKTPLWKSNSMAPLYHGLDATTRKGLEHHLLPSQMSREAEEVKVRLVAGEDGVLLLRSESRIPSFHDPAKSN